MAAKTISFVLPVYNEAKVLPEFYRVLSETIRPLEGKYRFELLFVNDGSRDSTDALLQEIAAKDKRVKVIEFARNFGHQIAITAGIDHAKGDAVIIMDTDLQDPPRTAVELIREWEAGSEVVYAVRATRKDGFWKRATARTFYKLLAMMSDYPIPENAGDFRLFDRKAADAMKQYREAHRYMRGISAHIGFKQKAVPFDRDERYAGETHYPLRKMLRFSADAMFSFSTAPLRFMTKFGFFVSGISVLGIIYAVVVRLFFSADAVPGWSFIVVAVLFVGGVQFIMLGILGEYIGRIYAEAKGRPLYIVSLISGEATGNRD
jgi:dolichol-phosphate mannosyltransferase